MEERKLDIYKIVQSHIYELHAVLAGTITLLLMSIIKIPIKRINYNKVYGKEDEITQMNEEEKKQKRLQYQRRNVCIIFIACLVGPIVFGVCASLSSLISFQVGSALLSGLIALAEYAVLQQIVS